MLKYGTLLVLILGLCAGEEVATLKEGNMAPEFALLDHKGKLRKLSDYRGHPVVVYFYPKASTPG